MKTLFPRLTSIAAALLLAAALPAAAAIQQSVATRNAQADQFETTVGPSSILRGYDGTLPADCAAARNGTVVFSMTLPSDWLSNASNGTKSLLGTWQDTSADAAGTVDYFTIFDSTGTTCHLQGTLTMSGGGGDIIIQNTNIAAGQSVSITSFTYTQGGG